MEMLIKGIVEIMNQESIVKDYRNLTRVEIQNSVTEIPDCSFLECKKLESIKIPNSVEKIGNTCFYACNKLKEIEIPDSVKFLGSACFYICRNLEKIKLSNGLKSLSYACFEGCQNLSEIKIPDSVKRIGKRAFYNCKSLVDLEIPSSVDTIESEAFLGCSSLKYNEFDNGLYLGNQENPYMVFVKVKNKLIQNCIIHSDTKVILDSAFKYYTKLKSIKIPDSVKKVGESAFLGCSNLSDIEFSSKMTSLSEKIFKDCENLKSIVIPKNIKKIKMGAFWDCKNLESVTFHDKLKGIEVYAFSNCKNLKFLEIPKSLEGSICHLFKGCNNLDLMYLYENKEMITSLNGETNAVFAPKILLKDVPARNKIIFSKGFMKYYKNYDIDKAVFAGYKNYISKNRFKIYEELDENICKFMTENKIIKLEEIDGLLEKTTKNNMVELSAILLEYKNKNFSAGQIERQFERDLFDEKKITLSSFKNFWTVKKLKNGNFEICYYKGKETEIEIPYKVGNGFVEKISKLRNLFYGGLSNAQAIIKIKTIIISDGVKEIGIDAFEDCINLTRIKIPSSVTKIENAFNRNQNVVFEVEKDSYAESYAKKNNFSYINY